MARVLVLFAHPALEKSRVHRRLVKAVPERDGLTFNDLYEAYPRLDVDVAREQRLLVEHDVVVFQFPFYWYSTPPILKQWQDLVLEHGWAYGSKGTALRGKTVAWAVSTGGRAEAYAPEGHNRHTVRQLMAPLEQSMRLCGMRPLPPWVVYGTHRLDEAQIDETARGYAALLDGLLDDRLPGDEPDLDAAQDLNLLVAEWAKGGVA
jgi:glutathione-regulated potassium-efflux system ancillary protein KefG